MSSPTEIVAQGYDSVASAYADLERPDQAWPRTRWLDQLLDRLPDGAHVLDLGCATGVPVAARIAIRHQVTGVDISSVQVTKARQNVPKAQFICDDLLQVEFPPCHFDAVVSFYTIDHVPREHHHTLFERMYRWLRPGGHLLLSVEDADQPGTTAAWLDVPMYFSHFDAGTTERLVTETGFVVDKSEVISQREGSDDIPYLFLTARRPSDA